MPDKLPLPEFDYARGSAYAPPCDFRTCRVLRVHDGDTATLAIDIGPKGFNIIANERCRFARMNAPELNTVEGVNSRDHLEHLCETYHCPTNAHIEVLGRDNYGRLVVSLWGMYDESGKPTTPVNLNQKMIDDGFAKELISGPTPK